MTTKNDVTGIYTIVHVPTSRTYVGSSVRIRKRWSGHRGDLRRGVHHAKRLQEAWDTHGPEGFIFTVVEECGMSDLLDREQFWIDQIDPYFNSYRIAGSKGALGYSHSAETKAKVSAGLVGRVKPPEERANLSAALMGHVVSDETREKIAASKRGVPLTAEHRAKLGARKKGTKQSAEHVAKRVASRKLAVISEETRARVRLSRIGVGKGIPKSPEHRAKISAARKAWWASQKEITQLTISSDVDQSENKETTTSPWCLRCGMAHDVVPAAVADVSVSA